MKKIYLVAIAALSITALSLSACQNDVESVTDSSTLNNDSIVLHSKYMTPAQIWNLSTTRAADLSEEGEDIKTEGVTFGIRWGRKMPNGKCFKKKAGICWLELYPKSMVDVEDIPVQEDWAYSVLEQKGNGDFYTDILLAEKASFPESVTPYILVEEDESFWGTRSAGSTEFVVVQGKYLFDRELGPFGGYRINIEIHE